MDSKEIILGVYGIEVSLTGDGGGSITSELHENPNQDDVWVGRDDHELFDYNNKMDGIESMILGHAVAGIDITTPAYKEGIETAVQGCANG